MSTLAKSERIKLPVAGLRFRKRNKSMYEQMKNRGESDLTSILVANRSSGMSYQALKRPSISDLDVWKFTDIDLAVARIADAKRSGEKVGLVTDFDVDGITSACVLKKAMIECLGFSEENIQIFVNKRMIFGYGFNEKALANIFENSGDNIPTLLITADQGSNDNAQVKAYKEHMHALGFENADVIVTDHHHINEGESCPDAVAFINPQRPNDEFEDKTICGCVVALFLMVASRYYFIREGLIGSDAPPLAPLLTYASLATVADCVSLQSEYNRCIVRAGIKDINNEIIPAWSVLKRKINKPGALITTQDLGFSLGPAINADSRTGGDGTDAINFLLATNEEDAEFYFNRLTSRNDDRKTKENQMQEVAMAQASEQYYNEGRRAFTVYLPRGSHGIHGIVASRVKERFNCPTLIFSPVDVAKKVGADDLITASGRSIPGVNIYEAVNAIKSEIDLSHGGHPMAMGMKLLMKDKARFGTLFDEKIKEEAKKSGLPDDYFYPAIEIDHLLQQDELHWLSSMDILKEINSLEPYGQLFESPIFAVNGKLTGKSRPFGQKKNHIRLFFRDALGGNHQAVLWNYEREPYFQELAIGLDYTFAITIEYSSYEQSGVALKISSVAEGVNSVQYARQ
jgi:single-stranded-DNA-specific exonuclease